MNIRQFVSRSVLSLGLVVGAAVGGGALMRHLRLEKADNAEQVGKSLYLHDPEGAAQHFMTAHALRQYATPWGTIRLSPDASACWKSVLALMNARDSDGASQVAALCAGYESVTADLSALRALTEVIGGVTHEAPGWTSVALNTYCDGNINGEHFKGTYQRPLALAARALGEADHPLISALYALSSAPCPTATPAAPTNGATRAAALEH